MVPLEMLLGARGDPSGDLPVPLTSQPSEDSASCSQGTKTGTEPRGLGHSAMEAVLGWSKLGILAVSLPC